MSIVAMFKGYGSPVETIEKLFPYADRKNFRKHPLSRAVIRTRDDDYPHFLVELDLYLKAVEALDYAQAIVKELTEAFELMPPADLQSN